MSNSCIIEPFGSMESISMQETYPGEAVVEKIEAGFNEMAREVNDASVAARNAWIIFLALSAYFLVSLGGISHQDLLLNNPVKLPILDVSISLKAFFYFGPLGLLLLHFGLLMQHAMLARKLREFHDRVTRFEGASLYRMHRTRIQLHSYFVTQLIAGPYSSSSFMLLLRFLKWGTFIILPLLVFLGFQITFLPLHDLGATWAHRFYLLTDIVIMAVFGVFKHYPERSFVAGFGSCIAASPLKFLGRLAGALLLVIFSLGIATIPDERMDVVMTSIWRSAIPQNEVDVRNPRYAFAPTVFLFEGRVDTLTGRPDSLFGRNLVVTDTDLVPDSKAASGERTLNLRRRDLRYGVFDRSDLHMADMTGAIASGASFRETNLRGMKAEQADLSRTDMWRVQIGVSGDLVSTTADLQLVNLSHAFLREANLAGVDLRNAVLDSTDMREAEMGSVHWEGAIMRDTDMTDARNVNTDNFSAEQRANIKGLR
jgi:hypothetical protein